MPETEKLELWGIVEQLGHNRFAGRITEQVVAGAAMVRVDVPEAVENGEKIPGFTKFLAPSSLFGITPTDGDTARLAALNFRVRPLEAFHIVVPQRQPALPYSDDFLDGLPGRHDDDDDFDDREDGI